MIGGEHYLTPPARVENSLGEMLEKTTGEMVFFSTGRDALFPFWLACRTGASTFRTWCVRQFTKPAWLRER